VRSTLLLGLVAALLAASPSARASGYHLAGKIALPDGGWDLASVDPVLGRIYIARSDAVTAIDTRTGAVAPRVAPAHGGHAVVALKDGAEILVTDGHDDLARIYDAHTGALLAEIHTGQKPDAAIYDAASGLAVVMNGHSGDLTLIDPEQRAAVGRIAIGGGLELAAGDGAGLLFVNIEDQNALAVVDLRTRTVLKRIPLSGCDGPTGVAYLPLAHRLLSTCVNGVAAVTDPKAGKVVATLPIGRGPDSAMYDPVRHIAFVPAGQSGELDIFADTAGGIRPLGKVSTQRGARTGAVDPSTGRVYLPAADYIAAESPGGRPEVKPGSVVAVVIAP
jgi:DNA-binding beta-propeller fold protein YncE